MCVCVCVCICVCVRACVCVSFIAKHERWAEPFGEGRSHSLCLSKKLQGNWLLVSCKWRLDVTVLNGFASTKVNESNMLQYAVMSFIKVIDVYLKRFPEATHTQTPSLQRQVHWLTHTHTHAHTHTQMHTNTHTNHPQMPLWDYKRWTKWWQLQGGGRIIWQKSIKAGWNWVSCIGERRAQSLPPDCLACGKTSSGHEHNINAKSASRTHSLET